MRSGGTQRAGLFEVWAARAWNVFNEGRPFSVVYPPMAIAGAALVGAWPGGATGWGLLAALAVSAVWTRFAFPLRTRALLWLMLPVSLVLFEAGEAVGLLAVGLGGYLLFTVVIWGGLYYRLRTHAPRSNSLRFWRLVLTNSDPTSGNFLEQVPKLMIALSAAALAAREPSGGSGLRIAAVAAVGAGAGAWAWRRFAARRLPAYPPAPAQMPAEAPRARRVYVIVVDGCNRERLRQASALGLTPAMDRLFAEGTEYTGVQTAYPARTVVCFSSMLTGAAPAEHGMRSNYAPRLGVRTESLFDVLEEDGRTGRLVGIAHLLDAFGDERVRTVTSVQPTSVLDHSLAAAGIEAVEQEDPDLLVLQLLAADQLGHVRGTRSPEYLAQLGETDRRIGEFLGFLRARGLLDDASVILMADHGQGRGIGGHGHLDWGETPVPFCVWGKGAVPGAVCHRRSSIAELAATCAALLGTRPPAGARGRALVPVCDPDVEMPPGSQPGARALAIVPARNEEAAIGAVLAGLPAEVAGVPLDRLVIDDGSTDRTAEIAREHGARVIAHDPGRGLGAALRTGLAAARDRGYAAALYLDGDGEYDPRFAERVLAPVLSGRAEYVLGSRFLGERRGMTWHRTLANRTASACVSFMIGGHVLSDAQSGMRAFGRRALECAEIAHDYNYAQVLTLDLWGKGVLPEEIPIDYRRRSSGRSFVRYGEYARLVVPAVLRQWRISRAARAAAAVSSTAIATSPLTWPVPNSGSSEVNGPNGACESGATQPVSSASS